MAERFEIRLAGTGGQGMVLAGILLADAAVRDGKRVVQTQSYSPQARGGTSRSEVVISDEEIDYPEVLQADVLVCMSQEACDRFAGDVKEGGTLILEADLVHRAPRVNAVRIPITRLAREASGRAITANIVAVGLVAGLTGIVSRASLEAAVRERVPPGTEELNLKALAAGFEAAKPFRTAALP
ncbi:MAG TPA: 2-oxoacid:ferredoxin oxidoreductase subunit gamma [Anaerolineae bacterium]|nr:2-oxoacid:ferredoxin oxidoreductase subunit gamma [Anaerolineae bacterium]